MQAVHGSSTFFIKNAEENDAFVSNEFAMTNILQGFLFFLSLKIVLHDCVFGLVVMMQNEFGIN